MQSAVKKRIKYGEVKRRRLNKQHKHCLKLYGPNDFMTQYWALKLKQHDAEMRRLEMIED